MNPLLLLVMARLREFYREPAAIFWTFGFSTLLALALGLAFRGPGDEVLHVAVTPGPFQAERVRILSGDEHLDVSALSEDQASDRFRGGNLVLAVSGDVPLLYRFDPDHPQASEARNRVNTRLQEAAGRKDPLAVSDVPVSARGARYIEFLVPGLLGMNIMASSMWGIGWTMVESRKRKLLKRLAATPMRRGHFLLSFVLSRLVFLVAEVAVLLGFGWIVFDVQVQGSLAALSLMSILGAAAFTALGLLVASRTANTETASGLMNLVMMPMYVVSGVFFSSSHFPDFLQPIIRALPLTALNDGLRAVINEAADIGRVLVPLAILAVWGIAALFTALRLFRWT